MNARVLIVDDEDGIRFSLRGILEDEGYEVAEAETGEEGLKLATETPPDLIFLDIWLPGMDGLEVLDNLRTADASLPVIMISGHGNIETAVNAIKKGAYDFIEKPLSLEKVVISANKALEYYRLRRENQALRSRLTQSTTVEMTGNSASIVELRGQIGRVAPTDAWVLITGENGTGKEIAARSIHASSRRKDKPLVAVNCAAIPEELIESELFGHEKGAFTGAETAKTGKFEMAHQGTLFLDEIADMSLKTQAKILRILQEQSFERVGGHKTVKVDVRVIAATNKSLEDEIAAGRFREDLYYRLRVIPLVVPPLRQRGDDVMLLIGEFMNRMTAEHGFRPVTFAPDACSALLCYHWPGNVRELKNFVERMLIMHSGQTVTAAMLPPEYRCAGAGIMPQPCTAGPSDGMIPEGVMDFKAARTAFEARFLEAKLQEFGGNITRLAEAIGLERSYLYRKLKSYNIQTPE
ncbi:two component, sigma54 specific, transcriptional regulator, Fis family [Oleidesulfovibrio alaskensis G20]|jgi:two-component system nitrogen regulation response regulator NtrX|uniref:Two component, sigma54 specific, transcriptional regulator, Fis family n=1 Tax=Oleidesulfovibrio alaskensis (strain ATCC BAA-1058 / DSM 17464 / G20) TaxID=207559 RepID=Q30WZ9_OLEA2|nr:sigma-54 dependent transcriptional regulator [Oleidesulfovibrio alaskensis]ABB39797.1 two component, sigma54 specific, transcriptional regulator, Fis family [Oleidesulfovibrio alaskensis G20]MBG0773413.1 sigma-54-dependent Fis family transcriptional regulator [Oleidesulfovibrio alaskensis]MBL3581988.1 sigma-54-dependent Fis family transcriptional regulator [Oleidesulfovibrio alaskensis]